MRAKINDVADLAGVSIKTVSRVLNNEPNVRPETREKVRVAVRELRYVPSVSARSLAGQRSYMFAMFYDTASEGYLSRFQKGALEACRRANYHLIVEQCSVGATETVDHLVVTATQLRVDGVLLLPPVGDTEHIVERFADLNIPAALIAPGGETFGMPSVRMDDIAASAELTKFLIDQGHRRIGFIKGHPDHGATTLRLNGYLTALRQAGIEPEEALVRPGDFTLPSGLAPARELLSMASPPSAIFASNDDMAAAVIRVAAERGLQVPEELSVVGFDDALIASATVPPLTTVRQPVEAMAEAAIQELLVATDRTGRRPTASHDDLSFDHELIHRGSVSCGPNYSQEDSPD
ncbi:MAG: LacI family DNA-binding transcriptional regulator [Pseudomonadota bacterium]